MPPPPPAAPEPYPPRETTASTGPLPCVLLVTGVSGSGKSTIGDLLAKRLGWQYAEADDFHPEANLAKMVAGHPLTDEDRGPWLDNIAAWIDATTAAGRPAVVSCSALKRAYRDRLLGGRQNVHLIYLDADREAIRTRLTQRRNHFFPANLLDSQFADLEPPTADERPHRVPVDVHTNAADVVESLVNAQICAE